MATAFAVLAAVPAAAQNFPNRPIHLVASGPVGSAVDLVARLLADGLRSSLGQNVLVEDRPTANGAVAGEYVAHARPDGYTLLFVATSVLAINPHLNKDIAWNPLKDFTPIGEIGTTPSAIGTSPTSPYKTFADLVAAAKAKPGTVKFGTITLTLSHFVALAWKQTDNIDFKIITFGSQADMVTAGMSGDVDSISVGAGALLSLFESGRLRPLAVTSRAPLDTLPGTPSIGASVPGSETESWYGAFGPAGLDPAVVKRLNDAINTAVQDPGFAAKLRNLATVPTGGTPDHLRDRLKADYDSFGALIARAGLEIR